MTDDEQFEAMLTSLKKAAAALTESGVPFQLAGGIASWARGGPPSDHDVDLLVKPVDVERALAALEDTGMRTERPPEDWLAKAFDGEVMIDLIFDPQGGTVTDAVLERGDELEVQALKMRVMPAADILVTKLLALREHEVDYDSVLEVARSLREQVDWNEVRLRTADSPYAKAFFTLVDELGIAAL